MRGQRAQSGIAPNDHGGLFKLSLLYRAPMFVKPLCATGDPLGWSQFVHACIILYIKTASMLIERSMTSF